MVEPTRTEAPTLFSHAAVDLPQDVRRSEHEQVRDFVRSLDRRRLIFLAWQRDTAARPAEQFVLSLAPPQTCVAFVPMPPALPYLDYGVYDSFRDVAGDAALRLEARGVLYLGQLVQLAEGEVRKLARADDRTLDVMRARLALAKLRFGMHLAVRHGYDLPHAARA